MNTGKALILLMCCCLFAAIIPLSASSQQPDTLVTSEEDSALVKKHSPARAVLMSAVVPGLGQIYNRKHWKAPIVWAGLGTSIYLVIYNRGIYQEFRTSYLVKIGSDTTSPDPYPEYSQSNVFDESERFRKYMELSYIAAGLFYVLNLIDASVDAHLFYFDVSDDLSIHWQPNVLTPALGSNPSLGLTLTLKL